MENVIPIFILIPVIGFLVNAILPRKDELNLSRSTYVMLGGQLLAVISFTACWFFSEQGAIYKKWIVLLNVHDFEIYVDFVFDEITAVFLSIGAFTAFLVTTYSRNYLHREDGFKRFFATILFFYLGYNIIVLSGNLTTIFIGWEIVGVSSFLLIAFYRNRYIPVKNAVKIFSIYRLGDIAILLAMWMGHHIWHQNVSLHYFNDLNHIEEYVRQYPWLLTGFVICIFIAAAIKSAQFPFSAWLPRAMEGPTPSSAIFYSSLAVHLGILVLLRTYNLWVHVPYMQEVVIFSGVFSFIIASISARIQPSIKGQIAYAVIAQVGVIAIEVALGWHTLALIHITSHALLRSYQLLISPSIVTYAIRKQFFGGALVKRSTPHRIFKNLSNSIYILSLNEWYLDRFIYYLIWAPFKNMGLMLQKIPFRWVKWVSIILMVLIPTLSVLIRNKQIENQELWMSGIIIIAFFYILRIFTEKERVLYAWYNLACFHTFIACTAYASGIDLYSLSFYVGGVTVSFLIGHYAMNSIRKTEHHITLHGYQGHCYEYPIAEFWFFVSCLGLMGFPITSAFVGMELILGAVALNQYLILTLLLLSFFVNGLAMIRMYARIFLGPHVKTYHTQARKSS